MVNRPGKKQTWCFQIIAYFFTFKLEYSVRCGKIIYQGIFQFHPKVTGKISTRFGDSDSLSVSLFLPTCALLFTELRHVLFALREVCASGNLELYPLFYQLTPASTMRKYPFKKFLRNEFKQDNSLGWFNSLHLVL